ncbi:P1-P2 fusion protein [Triticum yellow stripe virus]|uniref:P1-P2 fusion protein n=1 Tax=Triticum yellow stripe virus TaxID=3035804 RepID=A0AA95J394_9VIRU|nr:P1-P2 fusion protein [Triticum yellow stripe virus]
MSNFSTFLWLSWFLSCFPAGLTYGTTTSNSPLLYSNLPWSGVYPLDTPQKSLIYSTAPQLDASQWTCPPCVQELNMPTTYGDFVQLLSAKINADSKRAALTAWNAFADLSVLVFSRLSATSHRCFGALLWFVALVWSQVLLTGFRTAVYVFTTYYLPVSYLCLLGIITRWTYMGLMWGFGTLPALVCLTALKSILRILTFKRCFNEKTVAGYDSYSVPQTPPKRSVIMMRRPNKEHIGYANCIRLFTGENALATVDHNLEEGCEFYSPRTGNAIPVTQFRVVFQSNKMDVVILVGPSNWEALLGCKGVHFTTAQRLAKSPAALYLLNADGEWRSHSAKIVGHFDNFAQVLSNTKVGHSGAGYFYGKTLVGLHKGHPGSDFNFNLMAPLPGIPGLTSPQYIVESPPPQGLIFPEDVVDVIETTIKEARSYLDTFRHSDEIHSSRKQWKSGIAWADLEDESGNEEGGSVRLNKRTAVGRRQAHPRRRKLPSRDCCSFFTEGTTAPNCVASHVHNVDDNPCMSRCYCNIPGHGCPYWTITARHNEQHNESAGSKDRHVEDRESNNRSGVAASFEETTREARFSEEARAYQRFFDDLYTWEVQTSESEIPGFRRVGSFPPKYYPRPRGETAWGRKLCAEHPLLGEKTAGFGWPQVGAAAELKSLRLQASRWLERSELAVIPSDANRERVIQRTVAAYSNCKTNAPRCARDQLSWQSFKEDFIEAVQSLQLDAGVGLPMIAAGLPTHRGWVEDPKLLPVLARLTFDRLLTMSKARLVARSPEQLVREGLCDPIRLFVKQEPHKQSKLDEGRYRLIMSVSLVDQLVARVLFQRQNKSEIALWSAIPSKPGFGLSTEDQTRHFMEVLAGDVGASPEEICDNWRDLLVPTDCSGFDWSVSDWMLADDMEVRNRLTMDCNELTRHLRSVWLQGISNSILCLSDGTMLAQTRPGVQKSGSYNTSSSNSRIRVMAAYHCGASWAIAMGDDALEAPDSDLSKYKSLGFKVEVSGELEFCSHVFKTPDLAIPVNANKMLYRLIHGYDPECGNAEVVANYLNAVVSVLQELRHDRELCVQLEKWLMSNVATKQSN